MVNNTVSSLLFSLHTYAGIKDLKMKHEVRKFEKIPLLEPYEVYPESNPKNLVCEILNDSEASKSNLVLI